MKRLPLAAALLCTVSLAAGAARADTTYVVDKVTITGSKTVPTQTLLDSIQTHKGAHVTQADIVADQDTITKVLGKANVVGGIKTSMATKSNKHIEVTFALDDQGAQAPTVTHVAPKLHAETFTGNVALTSDQLTAAAGLKIGQDLTNEMITAAQKAIAAAYTALKKPIDANVSAAITQSQGGADVAWKIIESKTKKKNHHTDDDRSNLEQ